MKGTGKIKLREKEWTVPAGKTVREALKSLNLNPQAYLPVKNNELISEDTIIEAGDEILLIAVISGGTFHEMP